MHRDLKLPTEADGIFFNALKEGKELWEAAYLAFPMMNDPIEHAQELMSEDYMAARFANLLSEEGMTDKNLAQFIVQAFKKAEESPAISKAEISALKEIAHLKRLYTSDRPKTQSIAITNEAPRTPAEMMREIMKQALDVMPEEDLIAKVRQPIIEQTPMDDSKVFEV